MSPEDENLVNLYVKVADIVLAVDIFVYMSVMAHKAISNDEGEELPAHTDEEALPFLSPGCLARQSAEEEDERYPYLN